MIIYGWRPVCEDFPDPRRSPNGQRSRSHPNAGHGPQLNKVLGTAALWVMPNGAHAQRGARRD